MPRPLLLIGLFIRHNSIALLALFLALGGTSYAAASLINGSKIKPHSIPKNRLTNQAIAQLNGNRGAQGLRGPSGPQGLQGAAGTARAYALVNANGTIVAAQSHNASSVEHVPNSGVYCVELDPSVPAGATGAVVSPYFPGDQTGNVDFTHVEWDNACGTNGEAVVTFLVNEMTSTSSFSDQSFFIVVP